MPLPTCAVLATIYNASGLPIQGAQVTATLSAQEIDGGMVVPTSVSAITGAAGTCTLALWPNSRGSLGSTYTISVKLDAQGSAVITASGIAVPADVSANLEDLIEQGATEAVPGVSPATAYWLDPQAQQGAVLDGETVVTTEFQDTFDIPADAAFPDPSKEFGKGAVIIARPGIALTGPHILSTWSACVAPAQQAASVWKMDHTVTTGTNALLEYTNDNGQSSSIGSQPLLDGLALHGDKAGYPVGSTATEHGVYMPDLVSDKDDAPFITNTIIANFKGNGLYLGRGHKQLRAINTKSIAHDGWSFYGDHSSDSKLLQVGFGRSATGQVYLEDCASMQFAQYDFWTPGNGAFTGQYCLDMVSCRNARFYQGEIQGVVHILGDNCEDGVQTQHQELGIVFAGFNIKVSPETYAGTQYPGGGGSTGYDAMVQLRGANGVKFADGIFGYSQGEATAEELAATPKYVFEFTVDGGRTFANEAGHVELSNVSFLHMHYVNGVRAAEVPFTRRIAKNPERVVWRTDKPGELKMLPTATAQVNLIMLTGSTQTLNKADYPLLYLGMDDTRQMSDGATTFTIPAAAGTLPSGYSWFVVAW